MSSMIHQNSESLKVLAEAPFFSDLSDAQRRAVLALSRMRECDGGQHLYRLGEPADTF